MLAVLKLAIYAVWMLTHSEFRRVIYDYAPPLLGALILHILAWSKRAPGAGWMVAGVPGPFAAAAIQLSGVILTEHFNHNDLYHSGATGGLRWFLSGCAQA